MKFNVQTEQRAAVTMLRVSGEIDILTAPRLLDAVCEARDTASLAFDLSAVSFMDSSGLSVLMSAKRQANERKGHVYILGLNGHLERLFNLVHVGNQFRLITEEELP